MLGFETLTLAPIARELIVKQMLTKEELAWINAYHARVWEKISRSSTAKRTLGSRRRPSRSDVASVRIPPEVDAVRLLSRKGPKLGCNVATRNVFARRRGLAHCGRSEVAVGAIEPTVNEATVRYAQDANHHYQIADRDQREADDG